MQDFQSDKIRQKVRETYGAIAGANRGCGCAPPYGSGGPSSANDVSVNLGYTAEDLESVPEGANLGLGCGNPQAIAKLRSPKTEKQIGC